MQYIIITFIVFFALRLVSLSFSIRNEKLLLKKGGVQYGKLNSLLLTLAHIAYYFSALYEAHVKAVDFNSTSIIGVGVMTFAYAMLFYVIYKLRDIWTVKLYIVPNQRIERSFLLDRKSTRLNSSHANISYAVFCLKKKIDHLRHR